MSFDQGTCQRGARPRGCRTRACTFRPGCCSPGSLPFATRRGQSRQRLMTDRFSFSVDGRAVSRSFRARFVLSATAMLVRPSFVALAMLAAFAAPAFAQPEGDQPAEAEMPQEPPPPAP